MGQGVNIRVCPVVVMFSAFNSVGVWLLLVPSWSFKDGILGSGK